MSAAPLAVPAAAQRFPGPIQTPGARVPGTTHPQETP